MKLSEIKSDPNPAIGVKTSFKERLRHLFASSNETSGALVVKTNNVPATIDQSKRNFMKRSAASTVSNVIDLSPLGSLIKVLNITAKPKDIATELEKEFDTWWNENKFYTKHKAAVDKIIDENYSNIEWGEYEDYDEPDLIDEGGDAAYSLEEMVISEFSKFVGIKIPSHFDVRFDDDISESEKNQYQEFYDEIGITMRDWAYDLGFEYAQKHGLQG